MISTILGVLGGFLGTALTTFSNYKMRQLELKEKELDRAHELAKIKAETDAMIAETNASIQIAETQVRGAVDMSEAEAFRDSQKSGKGKSLMPSAWLELMFNRTGWERIVTIPIGLVLLVVFGAVDALKEGMRSVLTAYIVALSTWVSWLNWQVLERLGKDVVDAATAMQAWGEVTNIILMLMVTLVTWWFGDRRMAKHLMHLKEKGAA